MYFIANLIWQHKALSIRDFASGLSEGLVGNGGGDDPWTGGRAPLI
ncbi:MAG: hypothetical protein IJS00_07545 [Paludibacteraceae bacterium]|nr:hypothetical protein [Paludibacteraceae bacterium]